jgi:hypothetical protein
MTPSITMRPFAQPRQLLSPRVTPPAPAGGFWETRHPTGSRRGLLVLGACHLFLALTAATASHAADIAFALDKPGRVSLAVYDTKGIQVRTLRNAEPLEAGKHTIAWDGLDRNGQPVPAGDYTWKLLQTQGLTAEFLLNIGTSTLEHWPGNHGGLTATAVVGDQLVMTAGNSESPVTTVCLDLATGKRLANSGNVSAWHAITDLAYDDTPLDLPTRPLPDGHLYMTVPEDGLVLVGRPTGQLMTDDHWRKKYKFPTHFIPLRRLDFTDGKAPAQDDWTAVPPDAYTKERGFGWEDAAGITGFAAAGEGDQSGHAIEPIPTKAKGSRLRTFLVDVPVGGNQRYEVTFHLGHPDKPLREFLVYGGEKWQQPAWLGTLTTKAGEVTSVSYAVRASPGTKQLQLAFGPRKGTADYAGCAIRGMEIATGPERVDAHKGKVVITNSISGLVQELSTDAREILASYPVPGVRDVAVLADGTILALREDAVVKVEPNRLTPLLTGLTAAALLSVDRSSGELFIVEGGTSQQIKRYGADYTLKATHGRQGGRRQGLYEPQDFMAVSSLSPDGKGGFVITEAWSAPRRTAHFDRDGKLIKEWYGGQLWATNASVDPQDDTRVWFNSHWGWIVEAEVDWKNRTWKPRSTYKFQGLANELVGGATGQRGFFDVVYRDGKKYLAGTGQSPRLLRVDEAEGRLTPVMTSSLRIKHAFDSQPPFIQKLLGSPKTQYRSYLWQDTNGDGEPQEGEIRLSEWGKSGPCWTVSANLAFAGIYGRPPQRELTAHSMAPGPDGYPSFEEAASLTLEADASLRDADKLLDPKDGWRDTAGNWYAMLEGKGDGYLATSTYGQGHATAWPANLSGSVAFAKWDAAGKLMWKVGNKARRIGEQRRGELHAPVRVLGEVNGCIGVADRIAQPAEFWTTDGLYVGGLFDHRTDDGLPAAYYAWRGDQRHGPVLLENQSPVDYDMVTGGLLLQRANGEVIYCADGWNNLPTYRITGWDKLVRQEGTLRLAEASKPAATAGTGLAARYAAAGTGATPMREGVDPQIWFGDAEHKKLWPEGMKGEFTASWSGLIEPKFSEDYLLRLYVGQDDKKMPEEARLWIDGRLVIDTTKDAKPNTDKRATVARFQTEPLPLTAGKQVPVKLEYKKTGSGGLHLSWESMSQSIEHVPASALYPR